MRFLKSTYPILHGALILTLLAFFNGYPFVYSDTGTYIASGFGFFVPIDRPIAYGLFIRFFGSVSLWTVVIAQNLITSYILYQAFRLFFPNDKNHTYYFYLTISFLTLFTGIAWYSNQIMPDFLAPIVLLSIFILLYDQKPQPAKFIFIASILGYSLITHFSHLLISSFTVGTILLCNFLLFRKKLAVHHLKISFKRAVIVTCIALSGWLTLPSLNKIISGEFYNSKSSHIFLMASTAEKGILERFLNDKCDEAEFSDCKLCKFKNEIPGEVAHFIWDGDSSVFMKTGGWLNSQKEYDKILRATLLDPKYSSQHLYKSIAFGMTQLFENRIGEGFSRYREDSAPYMSIHHRYRSEVNMFLNSRQNKMVGYGLGLGLLNDVHFVLLILCLLSILFIYFSPLGKQLDKFTVLFLSCMILGVIINSMVTAGLSAPYGRYQTRVSWLIPFSMLIIAIRNWSFIKNSVYNLVKRGE